LFNCLSNAKAQAANFPFCTIEPNLGVISVPDERLLKLEELVKPQKVVPAVVEIVDIAGLVKGASKGEGLGNQFLANIRETDAIIHVLRCFDDANVIHVEGSVNPIRDKEIIDIELQLKDFESVEKSLQKVARAAKTGTDKEAKKEFEALGLVTRKQFGVMLGAGIVAVTMAAFLPNIKRAYDNRTSIAETLSATIATSGIDQAAKQYHELKAAATNTYNLDEDELNALGYQLIQAHKLPQAIRIFQLNTEAFPHSGNTYDSLAEAYMDDGNKSLAVANYQRSLQLNPKNANAKKMLQKLGVP